MQAQATREAQKQKTISPAQSTATVQALLRASLGAITYLRDLLPQDNFCQSYLTSSGASSQGSRSDSFSQSQSSQPSDVSSTPLLSADGTFGERRALSGYKVKVVQRGWSAEGDRLLDYLEYGLFDAIDKKYLRSFIFAIYLDENDPNNIVEAYTFNFKYYALPGTNTIVPVMSLGDELLKLSLNGKKKTVDPAIEAIRSGRMPTMNDVKRAIKSLVKSLVMVTQPMDSLPRRKFVSVKAFYYPHTPDDYEPPHFEPGDVDKDRWFFTTHERQEAPEKFSIGSLDSGHHGVHISVASVSGCIPSAKQNATAPFTALDSGPHIASTFVEDEASRRAHIEATKRDALQRKVVWDAETFGRIDMDDLDAEGEIDSEYQPSGSQAEHLTQTAGVVDGEWAPLGVRNEKGDIIPLSFAEKEALAKENEAMEVDEDDEVTQEQFIAGQRENVPTCIRKLAGKGQEIDFDIEPTQVVEHTQLATQIVSTQRLGPPTSWNESSSPARANAAASSATQRSSLPPSELAMELGSSLDISRGLDTQMVIDAGPSQNDDEILNTETQIVDDDPIQSFEGEYDQYDQRGRSPTPAPQKKAAQRSKMRQVSSQEHDDALQCLCGMNLLAGTLVECEGGCGRWHHIWCMGYHSEKDKRLPNKFTCFECRIRNHDSWEIIYIQSWCQEMFSQYSRLALFRRSIKIVEVHEPRSHAEFTRLLKCEAPLAGQLFKRLETEGFLAASEEAPNKSHKKKAPKGKQRKNLTKVEYIFVKSSKRTTKYHDYFNPSPEVEIRLIGMEKKMLEIKTKRRQADIEDMDTNETDGHSESRHLTPRNNMAPPPAPLAPSRSFNSNQPFNPFDPPAERSQTQQEASQTQEESQDYPPDFFLQAQNRGSTGTQSVSGHKRKLVDCDNGADDDSGPGSRVKTRKRSRISIAPALDLCD